MVSNTKRRGPGALASRGPDVPFVYLASRSPRRRQLLRQLGVAFEVVEADIDETALPSEDARALVIRLAQAKAESGGGAVAGKRLAPILGADTVVEIDGEILGKPRDRAHAEETLAKLSGRCHRVFSAVALWSRGAARVRVSQSEVCFRPLDARERRLYCESGEALDKAGAYAIQGLGATFIEHLSGSPSGVMGLPLRETADLLREAGIEVLARRFATSKPE